MKRICTALLGALSTSLLYLQPCAALADDGPQESLFETTLFGSYRFGGGFEKSGTSDKVHLDDGAAYAIAFNWEAADNAYYEISYSRQDAKLKTTPSFDLTIDYLQIGGYVTFENNPQRRVVPYFLMTVGAARYTPKTTALQEQTKFAAAIGTGVKFPITSHLAIRLDGRMYATFFENQNDVFCSFPAGGCVVSLHGETLLQTHVSLGFTAGF